MCQGLGQKKHDEISEIDRMCCLFALVLLVVVGSPFSHPTTKHGNDSNWNDDTRHHSSNW